MSDQAQKEKFEQIYRSRREIFFNNFLGGIGWRLGTLVGAVIIVGIIGFLLSKVNVVPLIGSWLAQIIQEAIPKNQILMPK